MSSDASIDGGDQVALSDLQRAFEGVIPAVIATASSDGIPNVTYLSRIRIVDDDHVALSNQFFSKTTRNLAENPVASLIVTDPWTFEEHRLEVTYERTERRGPVFDRLREDVAEAAALHGMEGVFHLRTADIYRVLAIDPRHTLASEHALTQAAPATPDPTHDAQLLAELTRRVSRSADLDTLVSTVVRGLDELFGYDHSLLLLTDEHGERLYTIASHGYDEQGVGSEVVVGEGVAGMAASRCRAIRVGGLGQMAKYARSVSMAMEGADGVGPGREIPLPGLPHAQSQLAVPAQALGQLVGVLLIESDERVSFDEADQHRLEIVATMIGGAIEIERSRARADTSAPADTRLPSPPAAATTDATHVRYYAADGSTFLDGDYLIKGVAGRILWALLQAHATEGRTEFTNREVRLDPSLELPEFRDNFESRLILLKRRLDERTAPVRVEKVGRGRFRLVVTGALRLDSVGDAAS